MLPAEGCVTASANAVATAASTALPPSHNTSTPTWDATKFWEATIPLRARVGTVAAAARPAAARTLVTVKARSFMVVPEAIRRGALRSRCAPVEVRSVRQPAHPLIPLPEGERAWVRGARAPCVNRRILIVFLQALSPPGR